MLEKLRHHKLFMVILLLSIFTRVFLLGQPAMPVFDEIVYVEDAYNMARLTPQHPPTTFLGTPLAIQSSPLNFTQIYGKYSLGQDFNIEHPPLAKAIIAFFLAVFSPDTVSFFWARVPSLIMGVIALLSFYGIALRFLNVKYASLAVLLLSFDNMFWIHSRTALLDIYMLGFMMLGMYVMLRKNGFAAAPIFMLATLSKITGITGFLIIGLYQLIQEPKLKTLKTLLAQFIFTVSLTFLAYTALLQFFGLSTNPFIQLDLMRYGLLARQKWTLTLILGVAPLSQPWNWLFNETPIRYAYIYRPDMAMLMVNIMGMLNPALILLSIPVLTLAAYSMVKTRDSLSTFAFIWFMAMWLPYFIPTWFGQEQYLHHMLSALPPLVLLIANWLKGQSKFFTVGYVAFVLLAWLWYYPYPFLWLYVFGGYPTTLPPLSFFG